MWEIPLVTRYAYQFSKVKTFISQRPRVYQEYRVAGWREELEDPKLKFRVHLMELTKEDNHKTQFVSKHIPHPVVSDRRSGVFHLPLKLHIVYESNFVKLLVSHLSSE